MNTTKLLTEKLVLTARNHYIQGLPVFSHSLSYPNF